MFAGSPIKRIGVNRMIRNCLIAAGNSGDAALRGAVERHIGDDDPVVAEAAEWAIGAACGCLARGQCGQAGRLRHILARRPPGVDVGDPRSAGTACRRVKIGVENAAAPANWSFRPAPSRTWKVGWPNR